MSNSQLGCPQNLPTNSGKDSPSRGGLHIPRRTYGIAPGDVRGTTPFEPLTEMAACTVCGVGLHRLPGFVNLILGSPFAPAWPYRLRSMPRYVQDLIRPVQRRFRLRRMEAFVNRFGVTDETTILDVGGVASIWEGLSVKPRVTILNFKKPRKQLPDHITFVVGDGTGIDFPDRSFDIAFSNSTIEHLGNWENQQRFAIEMRRVGRRYYVQTPHYHFPIEPHYLAPFVHWLPPSVQKRVVRFGTPWGWIERPSKEAAAAMVEEIRLLVAEEMERLFPDGTVDREVVGGLTKSLIAYRL